MYIKLDEHVESLLCCSFCKGDLVKSSEGFACTACAMRFPLKTVAIDNETTEQVYDFRIHHPDYCMPSGVEQWADAQDGFEDRHFKHSGVDSLQVYLDEIESVREIYTEEFHLQGNVLDIGSSQGRLRHYLNNDADLYVGIDPFINVFRGITQQPNLLKAYPALNEPCNFIAAFAEYLPFKTGSFDWVHMRSAVDHFKDPYLSFVEAYRCSKVGGKVLVGLSIMEKKEEYEKQNPKPSQPAPGQPSVPSRLMNKLKNEGVAGVVRAASERLSELGAQPETDDHDDDHMFRFSRDTLIDLYKKTGWNPIKEHWQKPPHQYCLYASGEKTGAANAAD